MLTVEDGFAACTADLVIMAFAAEAELSSSEI